MGQLRTLLWKNFIWCARHPIKTAFFYILPLLCASFIFLTLAFQDIHTGDCDFETFALPPSHPLYLLASMTCNRDKGCANQQPEYQPYYRVFQDIYARNKTNQSTLLCPGLSREDFNFTALKMIKSCVLERKKDASLGDYSYEDLVNRGLILYYPKTPETDALFEKIADRTDNVNAMKEQQKKMGGETNKTVKEQMEEGRETMKGFEDLMIIKFLKEQTMMTLCFDNIRDRTRGFENRSDALKFALGMNLSITAPWAVVELNSTRSSFVYKIITHLGQRHRKSTLILQSLIEAAAIETLSGERPDVHLEMKTLPKRCHKNPFVLDSANHTIGLVITLGLIVLAQTIAAEVSSERTTGLLDFLIIAGVSKWKVKLSWFIFGLLFCLSTMLVIAVFFYFVSPFMLNQTPFSLFLAVSLLYGLSFLFFCLAIANLAPTAQRASILVLVLLFVCYLVPRWGILIQAIGYTGRKAIIVRVLSLIFGPVAIQIIYAYIILGERDARPVTWSTLFESPSVEPDEIKGVGEILVLMLIQIAVYAILSTDLVPWLLSFSCRRHKKRTKEEENGAIDLPLIEPLVSGTQSAAGIEIDDLVKVYSAKKRPAVDGLKVTFYKNQITAFLGHNGAGKSTTMNILTGMKQPTSGTAFIDGRDISTHMSEIRKNLGFCPQHDIVYPDLTVAEHLWFYGSLRGMPEDTVQTYADTILHEMKIDSPEDRNKLSSNLSGGNKRKLSIAIAFLGEPATVVLDEPTSAIDPFSRRAIWDVILRYRSKSTLLISTHYMQEADLLGDRIAIIDQGQLKCYGSPMFLKGKYGSGSFIKVAHEQKFDHEALNQQMQEFVPSSLFQKGSHESSYSVPLSAVRSTDMVHAFEWLEGNGKRLGVNSFGLSESTMEQVFFNVTSEALASGAGSAVPEQTDYENNPLWNFELKHETGSGLFRAQFLAMLEKRWNLIKRSKTAFIFQILLPLAFTGLMLFFVNIMSDKQPPTEQQEMHPWSLNLRKTFVAYSGEQGALLRSILKHGLGTKCSPTRSSIFNQTCSESGEMPPAGLRFNETKECDCSHCPADAAGPDPPQVQIPSLDYLINLNGRNMTDFLLKSAETGFIGAIEVGGEFAKFNLEDMEQETFQHTKSEGFFGFDYNYGDDDEEDQPKLPSEFGMLPALVLKPMINAMTKTGTEVHTLWMFLDVPYNEGAPFARESVRLQISFLNAYNNALLRSKSLKRPDEYSITMYTEEVNFGGAETDPSTRMFKPSAGGILGMFSGLALLMPIFSTAVVIVNENASGNKQLQITMGLGRFVYWLSNFLWDFTLFLFSFAIMLLFMLGFPDTFNQDMPSYVGIGICYGLGVLLLVYWLSFVFQTARNCITAVGNIAPFFSFAAFILMMFKREDWYEAINERLLVFPPYFITETIMILDFNAKFPFPRDLYTWEVLGKRFAASIFFILLMLVLILLCETGIIGKLVETIRNLRYKSFIDGQKAEAKDADVEREERAILEGQVENVVLKAEKMSKFYSSGKRLAVSDATLGIRRGECFGLLGTNGAGKTTFFKLLSSFLTPTRGHCSVLDHRLDKHQSFVHKNLGYCPQEDILFERLRPDEHLELYGKIKGIPAEQRKTLIPLLVQEVGLGPHKSKNSEELSGGNKRKLNFAIAVMDFPAVIFLDEMTTGLDPEARRAAWNVLVLAIKKGSSAIITSHSMEECEALCNRLVIMVNGRFKCLGGVQYLKDKYGNNYNVKFRLETSPDLEASANSDHLYEALRNVFPSTSLVEKHLGFLETQLPAADLKLSRLFATIQSLKEKFRIEEFSVSQTTLEHVFVNMVKDQA